MTFSKYLVSKKNFLIIWFTIHGLALFVNVCGIKGHISESFNIFTSGHSNTENFWPFVAIANQYYPNFTQLVYEGRSEKYWVFNGIFYQYDFSEFIAYLLFIFLLLYIIYTTQVKTKYS